MLALVHAELGAMYPLSGGSARFPHYAYGGFAGASFGWFSWIQAVRWRRSRCRPRSSTSTHYHFAQRLAEGGRDASPTPGSSSPILLMALLAVGQLPRRQGAGQHQQRVTWWKVGVPLLHDPGGGASHGGLHTSNFHAADGFNPYGLKGILLAIPVSGIIFSYLGFEQADQLAGESKNPKRDIPFAVIGSIVHRPGHLHPAADRVPARPSRQHHRREVV